MSAALPVVYGISNCDSIKRARAWLEARGFEYRFHDFRKSGVPLDVFDRWMALVGWQALLNRQGTTWRKLDDARKAAVSDTASARALMLEHPSAIKRPVVDWPDGEVTVGFVPDLFRRHTGLTGVK